MTLLQEAPPATATGPTVRTTAERARGPVAVVLALLLVGGIVGALSGTGESGRLDPDSFAVTGSRAVAELLRDRGVEVVRVDTVPAALEAGGDVLLVPEAQALAPGELEELAGTGARLVVVGADEPQLEALGVEAELRDVVEVDGRRPACELPAAARAGDADLGGGTYRATGDAAAVGCYASSGDAALLDLGEQVLLGDASFLTNDRLPRRGNAALGLGLLGRDAADAPVERLVWLVPRPGRAVGDSGQATLRELVADGVYAGAAWLLVTVGVVALWRARRLGRVVEEPLPVVVRAAEAVEGRSRLYRASGARGQASEALRQATRDRLVRRVGASRSTSGPALVAVVAERAGADPAEVDGLLYGAAPADDDALVRLADALRTLERTLTQEVAGS